MKRFYRINQYIQVKEVRVVDETGKQLGVLPLQEALFISRQRELDLVEVAPDAKPPVCKIIDFKKFKYQESKKEQAGKKKTKKQDIKEIRFTPFIAENDFQIRVKRAKEFLQEGDKVKLTVKFVGRQITRRDFGTNVLNKAIAKLTEFAKLESEPKWQGKLLMTVLKPIKNVKNKNT